jgi:hypothetical protein
MPEIGQEKNETLFDKSIYQVADKKRTPNVAVRGSLIVSYMQKLVACCCFFHFFNFRCSRFFQMFQLIS